MRNLNLKLAKFVPPKGRGILVFVDGTMSDVMSRIIGRFRETNPRENVFIMDPKVSGELPVDGGKVEHPFALPKYMRRLFRRLRLQMVLVDKGARPRKWFVRSALAYNSAVGFLDVMDDLPNNLRKIARKASSTNSTRVYFGLEEKGVDQAISCIGLEVVREPEEYSNFKKRVRLFVWKHFKARARSSSLRERTSFEQISETLRSPKSILCLGNGPSSEDDEVLEVNYDSVFRVNHRWLERGRLTTPDAVFTGALDSVQKTNRDILYVFITRERATQIVMKASNQLPKCSFTNADDLGFPLNFFQPYQPTNGVIMLYFAVMLKPEHLTVAGIDLYRDPRGCYPDGTDMPNDYTSAHNDQKELEMTLALLNAYEGDLTIIGDSLRQEYENSVREN